MSRANQTGSEFDLRALSAEWIRAVRGGRTQAIVSRRLGYRSNILYRWEAGVCFPTASGALRLAEQMGVDVRAALGVFVPGSPSWMKTVDVTSVKAVGCLLSELRGRLPIQELARTTGISRFALARWLKGQSEPTLPDFFLVVEKTSLRLLDFISNFAEPSQLPSLRAAWDRLVQSRLAAYEHPWSHAVLRALELRAYRELPEHVPGWIASRLAIEATVEDECIALLQRCGQIQWVGSRYAANNTSFVDTRAEPERARMLKAWWLRVALDRLEGAKPGLYAYNLCSLSKDDLARVEILQRKYYREMSQIIEQSTGSDFVVLYGAQLLRLDSNDDASLTSSARHTRVSPTL
jgi:transcriptional regulator with XRE-family HTH domain